MGQPDVVLVPPHDGGSRSNVVRYCATRRPPRVDFFAGRDIRPGEELLFDYGSQYWAGRESDIDAALDAQIFDPEKIESFREDPENFKAVYAASVVALGVVIGQAVVRWYKVQRLAAPARLSREDARPNSMI